MGLGVGDPFVTNLEDDPVALQGSPDAFDETETPTETQALDDRPIDESSNEEPEQTALELEPGTEPEATHEPVVDDAVTAKLARLERMERDTEIAQILSRREEEARIAYEQQARAEAEQQQIESHFSNQKKQIEALFAADKMSPAEFIQAMDDLTVARVEVSRRQLASQVQTYVESAIDGRLEGIKHGYKERQAFEKYAPEYVKANPAVADVIEEMRRRGVRQEDISVIIEAGRQAYKAPRQKTATTDAERAARLAGANEKPTRAARNTRQSDVEEDKSLRKLAREFFS